MLLSFEYTFPGGLPRMRLHRASLAILMFWKLPKMRMCWSAMTMRVRVAFSMARGKYKKGYQDIKFEPPYSRYVGDAADLAAIIRGEKDPEFGYEHDYIVQETLLKACGLPTS